MIEQGLNYEDSTVKEMTDIFETRLKNLEPKENEKKSSTAAKKSKDQISTKKQKRYDSNSRIVESSKGFSVKNTASYMENVVILQINVRIQRLLVNKYKQKKKKSYKSYRRSNKELNALIEKNKKRRKADKQLQHFQELQILDNESKMSISSVTESGQSRQI